MKQIRLGVNIDHIATLRNARGGTHPDPTRAAILSQKAGADGITAHLREDRRHIIDNDIFLLKEKISVPLNMEMAATEEMLKIALQVKPNACCIVPEKREEITTEGGLDVVANKQALLPFIEKIKDAGIRVSLFIDSEDAQIEAAKQAGADIVELHTGAYCHKIGDEREMELKKITQAAKMIESVGVECHAGHGLCFETVSPIAAIPNVVELNIGHFIMGEAMFVGLEDAIGRMRKLMYEARK